MRHDITPIIKGVSMHINAKIKKADRYQRILYILLAIIVILTMVVIISFYQKPNSLEKYIKDHPSIQKELDSLNKGKFVMKVEKNTIIYQYDTEDILKDKKIDDYIKNSLQESLEDKEVEKNCRLQISNIEEKTGIKGIHIKMVYLHAGEVVASKEY